MVSPFFRRMTALVPSLFTTNTSLAATFTNTTDASESFAEVPSVVTKVL